MSYSINADIIAPRHSSEIRVANGRTAETPTDDNSVVSKSYVDSLVTSGGVQGSSGTFSLAWTRGCDASTAVTWVKPNPYTVVLNIAELDFTGTGLDVYTTNYIPAAVRPVGTGSEYSTRVRVMVTDWATGTDVPSTIIIPHTAGMPLRLLCTSWGTSTSYVEGTPYTLASSTLTYSMVEP